MKNDYQGMAVTSTQRFVHGETRQRTEKKNVLGKTASVTEGGVTHSYYYYPDGSLAATGTS